MRRTIQIGNLDYSMDHRGLERLFAPFGAVHSAMISTHYDTGKSTGVGFVEMESGGEGESAIAALNKSVQDGRILAVCWSSEPSTPDVIPEVMVGPMNIVDVAAPHEAGPERRGLPQ